MVIGKLDSKSPGQVVNRKELLTVKNDVERENQYQLEPELLLVVLLSLVQNGNITVSIAGTAAPKELLLQETLLPINK